MGYGVIAHEDDRDDWAVNTTDLSNNELKKLIRNVIKT